ncbi:MAG: hypothetical protein J0M28_13360 [Thauera sp.]|nr:hypothetical protein [Thauera sp.]
MNGTARPPADDPLYGLPDAARPHYATGMLLDAQDFAAEQVYHRNRLARALAFASGAGSRRLPEGIGENPGATGLFGGGTLAGLRVAHAPAAGAQPEEIRVAPGLAVDRLGRLVEVPRAVCLRLQRWFDSELERDGGDDLRRAALSSPERFASTRLTEAIAGGGDPLPERAVIVDVFVRFVTCRQALTPAFASGPFDALDAVETSRLRDAYEVHFVPRTDGLDDDFNGLPLLDRDLSALSGTARRDALQDAVLDGWPDLAGTVGADGELAAPPGHPPGLDPTAIFLARVFIAVGAGDPPARSGGATVDNGGRRFLPHLGMMAGALGLGLD